MTNYQEKWTVGWGFSARCDLNCKFCYSSRIRRDNHRPELDLKKAAQFLENNKNYISAINFGTGECFLAPDFPELLQLCKSIIPGVKIAVTSNGALIDASEEKDHYTIFAQTIDELDISLDSHQASIHDHWRGKNGAWKRAMSAISLGISMNFKTSVVMVGTQQFLNSHNLDGVIDICFSMGIPLRINLFMPTIDDFSFSPSFIQVIDNLNHLTKRTPLVRSSDRLTGTLIENYKPGNNLQQNHSCRILPNGQISPSTYLITDPWTVEKDLEDLFLPELSDTDPFQAFTRAPVPLECQPCPYVENCQGGSIERRWLYYKNLNKKDPLCPFVENSPYKSLPLCSIPPTTSPWNGPDIHLDYLPTIVAIPPNGKE